MGRPFNGTYPQSKSLPNTITPAQQAAQQAAMIALGSQAMSYMPTMGTSASQVMSSYTPQITPRTELTPAQQAAKEKAQVSVDKS